jgi:hypothetical protein
MTTETEPKNSHNGWKAFLRKHWKIAALFVVGAVLALVGTILVFLWLVADTQSTGMVPTSLGLWTMGNMVTFILHVIFWEILLIGIPAIIGGVVGWQWWKRLPDEEKKGYHFFGTRSRTTGSGGGISVLFFIAFCIKVFIDGNWDVAVGYWTVDYVVGSMISILIWVVIIFGVPATLGVIWWISSEMKKKSSIKPNQTADTLPK